MRSPLLCKQILVLALLFVSVPALAITGPEVAQLLNSHYNNTQAQCVGNKPAYFCSGVLVRGSQGTDQFWKHDAVSVQSGAQSVTYLRADLGTRVPGQKNGVVLTDGFTAIGQGKTLEMLCAYPFELTVSGNRPDYGCGLSAATGAMQDPSSCAALGISDAPGWLRHFQQQEQQPEQQCSLSSDDPAQFKASLTAHQLIDDEWSARPNLLRVRNWAETPRQMPLYGLFYDVTQTGALVGAQKDQRDYFNATDDWLPILRMDLSKAPDAVFGFNQQDQLYVGFQVASKLNARYADTAAACRGDTPAYNCSGVLIRTTDASLDFRAWNPSPGSEQRNGVAFSYMRADVYVPRLAWAKNQGLIMKELGAPAAHPLTVRCAYPYDGATFYRSDSCNEHSGAPQVSRPCAEQGITTEHEWIAHFNSLASRFTSCSFTGETIPFEVSLKARALLDDAVQRGQHNEIIIAKWPQNIGEQLPLEAFFYTTAAAKPNAVFFQKDYFLHTGHFLPVVAVDLSATKNDIFSFNPEDQLSPLSASVKEANGNTLDPVNAEHSLTVIVPANVGLLPDDKLKISWTGAPGTPAAGSYTSDESLVSAGLEIPVPTSVVAFNLGKPVTITYTYIRNNIEAPASLPLNLMVLPLSHDDLLVSKPKILKAANNGEGPELDLSQFLGNAALRIDGWPHMAKDQFVWLRLKGEKADGSRHDYTVWEAPSRVTPTEYDRGDLRTQVPYSYLQALGDGSVLNVEFKVALGQSLDEAEAVVVPTRSYTVRGQAVPHAPSVKEANGGVLNPIDAKESLHVVVPAHIDLLPDDKLKISWTGAPGTPAGGSYTSDESLVSAGLDIPIPNRVVAFNLGKSVTVSYEIIRGNEQPIPSSELTLAVQPITQDDLLVAKPKILQAANDGDGPELDVNTLTGNATVRIGSWPHIAAGQYVWLHVAGTNIDGSDYERTLWGATSASRVSSQWVSDGFATNSVSIGDLRGLRDGSTLTVSFKATFDQSNVEAEAMNFPTRSYTIRSGHSPGLTTATPPSGSKLPCHRDNLQQARPSVSNLLEPVSPDSRQPTRCSS